MERGRGDREHQPDLHAGEGAEHEVIASLPAREQPVGREQDRHDQEDREDQLEEAAPRVLGIRQVGRHLHERVAAEQVTELHDDEEQEQQVERRQRRRDFRDPERWASRRRAEQRILPPQAPERRQLGALRNPRR